MSVVDGIVTILVMLILCGMFIYLQSIEKKK